MTETPNAWGALGPEFRRDPLRTDVEADVCIVGAGFAGLTTAYQLLTERKSVVVLDDGPIGGGESGNTTAHLSNAVDDRYFELERIHGKSAAWLAAASHTTAIDTMETIVRTEKIDDPANKCGLQERRVATGEKRGVDLAVQRLQAGKQPL